MSDTQISFPNWQRPYMAQPGQPNLAYFVVYGYLNENMSINSQTYRMEYMPQGLQMQSFRQPEDDEQVNKFRTGIFAELLQEQHPELTSQVNEVLHCFVVQCVTPDTNHLNDLRVAIGMVTYMLDHGCVAVFDLMTLRWWAPAEWKDKVFLPEKFSAFAHVEILTSAEPDGSQWYHTRGMRKFGRPDLSIHHVTTSHEEGVREMFNRFISYMAVGGNIDDGQEIRMASLPEGMICHHDENMENPDFNNEHVEISWPE